MGPRQNAGRREPARVAAHNLYNGNRGAGVGAGVYHNLGKAGRHKPRRRAKAGGMVGYGKVVIHRFGNADALDILAFAAEIGRQAGHGVHGIVAAAVEEVANAIIAQNGQHLFHNGVVAMGQFVAAAAQGHGGCVHQKLKILCGFHLLRKADDLAVQKPLQAVQRAVNNANFLAGHCARHRTRQRRVDGRRRAAALGYNHIIAGHSSPFYNL